MHKHLEQKYFGRKDILHAENSAIKLRKAIYQLLFHYSTQRKTNNLLHLYPILKTNWSSSGIANFLFAWKLQNTQFFQKQQLNWIIWNCISEIFHQNPAISQIVIYQAIVKLLLKLEIIFQEYKPNLKKCWIQKYTVFGSASKGDINMKFLQTASIA